MCYPSMGKEDVKEIIESTLPPGEEEKENVLDGRESFVDTLALAIAEKEDGMLLLSELKKKWPEAVSEYWDKAEKLAKTWNSP